MEGTRKPSSLAEGLRNTEIKRETDIRNSLGPQPGSDVQGQGESEKKERMKRHTDESGRETPGPDEE